LVQVMLGISASHDASAALCVDGALVAAIAEERMSRVKCDGEHPPSFVIDEVLRLARNDVTDFGLPYASYPEECVTRDSWLKDRNPLHLALIDRIAGSRESRSCSNTSFNLHKETVVCGLGEAVWALVDDRVDCQAIGPFWLIA
jgi:predicted NodU family carbamoyl transferase